MWIRQFLFCHTGIEGKKPIRILKRRWEDNIKMDLEEKYGGMDWIYLAEDRDRWRAVVNVVMNLPVK